MGFSRQWSAELGRDVTVAAYGPTVETALRAAIAAADEGIEIEVIDGRRRYGNGLLIPAGPMREPAARSGAMNASSRAASRRTSSPPSVVRSSRRSGTRQIARGR